jgi:anti-anti-sigma regulatory factor
METVVVIFAGEYDIACKREMRAELEKLVSVQNVVLDFSRVTFIDSTVIAELIRMHRLRAENLFERETMVVSTWSLRKMFDLLQLNKVFRRVETLDEGVGENADEADVRYAFAGDGNGPTSTSLDRTFVPQTLQASP